MIKIYQLSEGELDALVSGYVSLDQALFGVVFGILVASVITLLTVKLDDRMLGVFTFMVLGSAILSVFFGVRAVLERGRVAHRIEQIKR
ncbi:MAG: hypothetical protein Q7R39_14285 [Dehalococcoidia bacterium]|nr:hypothetical protein [Dehalococcoidia bacterium]